MKFQRSHYAVLALLVAVILLVLWTPGYLERAKKSKALLDCKTLVDQAKMFKLRYGECPQTLAQLTLPGVDGSAPYIEAGHLTDPWGREYQYVPFGRHPTSDPEVWSMGPCGNDWNDTALGRFLGRWIRLRLFPRPKDDPSNIIGSWQ